MIYSLGSGGLTRVDVSANNAKNNLPIGTVLKLNGYSDPSYVIVKNLGIDERFGYGARYQSVSLEDGRFHQHEAYALKHINEKQDNRIQTYYTDEIKTPEECLELYEKAKALEEISRTIKENNEKETRRLIDIGRKIALQKGYEDAVALIVAEHEVDESDIMTDYFATKTTALVILAASKNKRDLFPEMRKAAGTFEHTKHLAVPPTVNGNGDPLTESNRAWWHPSDEHREKYSMGAGYYLKASSTYSTGWSVSKRVRYNAGKWDDAIYISLAKMAAS